MSKAKQPLKMSSASLDEKDEAQTQQLIDLAQELSAEADSSAFSEAVHEQQTELHNLIKQCLLKKNDEVLYDALERTRYVEPAAYRYLRTNIEEASENVFIRRDGQLRFEVNAFVIPLFARSHGGLQQGQEFQDQDAFDQLSDSVQEAGLESRDARVVLLSHAYHQDEIDGITYSHLHDMIRDAAASLTDKKVTAIPAIERSFTGWPAHHFGADDVALELRFLLGFALKKVDDPFYHVPEGEAAADAWFEARAERFQVWSGQAAPLVRRCLANDGREIEVNFLYQDLFHGGKETGMAEYFTLQMMADLNHAMSAQTIAPAETCAVIAPAEIEDSFVLRVNLHAQASQALIASVEKPLDGMRELAQEFDDTFDALSTIGVTQVSVAQRFDSEGKAVQPRPYET